jgi:hypothetical protein
VQLFGDRDNGPSPPEVGWPWPWEDSNTTDYAYAWDEGRVWITYFGHGWRTVEEVRAYREAYKAYGQDETETAPEPEDIWPEDVQLEFPDMSERRNDDLIFDCNHGGPLVIGFQGKRPE